MSDKYVEPFTYLRKDRETDRLRRYYSVPATPRKLMLLPGRSNSSVEYLRFVSALRKRLEEVFPQSTAYAAGFKMPGISDDWTKMSSIQGIMPTPAGTPPYDVTLLMKERFESSKNPLHQAYALGGLRMDGESTSRPFELLPSTKALVKLITKMIIGKGEPGSIPVKESVSTGLPGMDKDLVMKKKWGDQWCDPAWASSILKLVKQGNLRRLYDTHDVMLAYTQGYRTQPDRLVEEKGKMVPKERLVYDWMGNWVTADRSLPVDWLIKHSEGASESAVRTAIADMFCCRSRHISISPYRATFPLRLVAHSVHNYMMMMWRWLFYHPDPTSLNNKLAGVKHIRLVDVENHDQSINQYILQCLIERLGELFSPEVVKLIQLMYHAPSLVRNDHRFESGASWRGNPFDEDLFKAVFVNPSGDPGTANLAKLPAIIYAVYLFIKAGKIRADESDITKLLNGTFDYGFFDTGDNLLFYDRDEASFLREEKWDSPLYFAKFSPSPSFLGFVPIQDTPGGRVTFTMNLQSFILNFFFADKGVESPDRRYWAFGWFERKEAYRLNPALKEMDKEVQDVARRTLSVSIDSLAEVAFHSPTQLKGLNAAEVEFITNQDVIYYKYGSEDIRPELLERYFLTYHQTRTSELWKVIAGG